MIALVTGMSHHVFGDPGVEWFEDHGDLVFFSESGHLFVAFDAVASARFGSNDRAIRMIRGIGQSGEGHHIGKSVGARCFDRAGQSLEALGVVALVVHAADEGVGFGGGTNESGSFQERPVFDGKEFHACGAQVFGVLDEVGRSPSGPGKKGPGRDDLFDFGGFGGKGAGCGQSGSSEKAEESPASVKTGPGKRRVLVKVFQGRLVIRKWRLRGKPGRAFSGSVYRTGRLTKRVGVKGEPKNHTSESVTFAG